MGANGLSLIITFRGYDCGPTLWATLESELRPQTNTRLRLHLEQGEAERSLIGGTFKVGSSPTGLPNGIVADPKLADLISDELLNEIANY